MYCHTENVPKLALPAPNGPADERRMERQVKTDVHTATDIKTVSFLAEAIVETV